MIQLVTDSSADLPKDILQRYNIAVVPLMVNIDGRQYLEGVDIAPQEFFDMMARSKDLPKTSQPTPEAFKDCFKTLSAEGPVLCLTISSGLSGTYQAACLGKEMAGGDVTVFDTLAGSLAHGLQVMEAGKLAEEGASVDEIVKALEDCRARTNILILLDTLENIVKGGRLSKFQGSVAKILNFKVLLEGIDGKVEMIEKVRGRKKFNNRVLDIIGERKQDFSDTVFAITYVDDQDSAENLKDQLIRRFKPKEIIIAPMGATMGTYAGTGGMILSFFH